MEVRMQKIQLIYRAVWSIYATPLVNTPNPNKPQLSPTAAPDQHLSLTAHADTTLSPNGSLPLPHLLSARHLQPRSVAPQHRTTPKTAHTTSACSGWPDSLRCWQPSASRAPPSLTLSRLLPPPSTRPPPAALLASLSASLRLGLFPRLLSFRQPWIPFFTTSFPPSLFPKTWAPTPQPKPRGEPARTMSMTLHQRPH
jgi:hypothetical protein